MILLVVTVCVHMVAAAQKVDTPTITHPRSVNHVTIPHGASYQLVCEDLSGSSVRWLWNSLEIRTGILDFLVITAVRPHSYYSSLRRDHWTYTYSGEWRCERIKNAHSFASIFVEVKTGCTSNPCGNGGTCVVVTVNIFTCSCFAGFTGNLCQTDIPVITYPQFGHEVTIKQGDPYLLACRDNFGFPMRWLWEFLEIHNGQDGFTLISSPPNTKPSYEHVLNDHWSYVYSGRWRCERTKDNKSFNEVFVNIATSCLSNPCENDGICINLGTNYSCECTAGFTGNVCQTVEEEFAPIVAPGTPVIIHPPSMTDITINQSDTFSLSCKDDGGFTLRWVLNDLHIIDGQNGFEVRSTPPYIRPAYIHVVKFGWDHNDAGAWRCERTQDPDSFSYISVTIETGCSSNPCLNGGTCVVGIRRNFTCNCTRLYIGTLCEADSGLCPDHHYDCPDHNTCIPNIQRCDGTQQCPDGSDEWDCFQIRLIGFTSRSEALHVFHVDKYYPVCWSQWNDDLNTALCNRMGFGTASQSSSLPVEGTTSKGFTYASGSTIKTLLSSVLMVSNCTSGRIVSLTCKFDNCGSRGKTFSLSQERQIVGGHDAQIGSWPWHIHLTSRSTRICGGSLISAQWALTAAHCIQKDINNLASIRLRLGSSTTNDPAAVEVGVQSIIVHPGFDVSNLKSHLDGRDLALLKLSQPVQFTDLIRPICLEGSPNMTYRDCYITGYGWTDYNTEMIPIALQEVLVSVLSPATCQNIFHKYFHEELQYCVGPSNSEAASCWGDSGGPLVCRTITNTWVQRGIISFGYARCKNPKVHTKLEYFRHFVEEYAPFAVTTTCPTGYIRREIYCYKAVSGATGWYDFRQKCKADGADLASIGSYQENDISTIIELTGCDRAWIGLNDLEQQGIWRWVSTGNITTFVHWAPGEPNRINNNEHCVEMVNKWGFSWRWNDVDCGSTDVHCGVCKVLASNNAIFPSEMKESNNTLAEKRVCGTYMCLNGANCTDTSDGSTCTCLPGFTGEHCERDIDECSSGACVNGATCNDGFNKYTCTCAEGYTGVFCNSKSVSNVVILTSGCSTHYNILGFNAFSLRVWILFTMNVRVFLDVCCFFS